MLPASFVIVTALEKVVSVLPQRVLGGDGDRDRLNRAVVAGWPVKTSCVAEPGSTVNALLATSGETAARGVELVAARDVEVEVLGAGEGDDACRRVGFVVARRGARARAARVPC